MSMSIHLSPQAPAFCSHHSVLEKHDCVEKEGKMMDFGVKSEKRDATDRKTIKKVINVI